MILITTPTGAIGSQVLRSLMTDATVTDELRVVVRDADSLPDGARRRVDVVIGSHGDAQVVDRALDGVDALLWVVPPDPRCLSLDEAYSGFSRAAVRALPRHAVRHVVGVSALGRGTPAVNRAGLVTASLAMDDLIAATGVAYRALTNPSFMDNLLRQLPSIRDDGVVTDTVSAGRRAPLVATRDIAAAAAGLLLDRSWTGAGSTAVLGPEDLSQDEMAVIMSDVLGRPVRYERQTLDAMEATLTGYGTSTAFARGMVDMMRAKDEGLDAGVDRTPTTSSPTTFRIWCEEVLRPAVHGA